LLIKVVVESVGNIADSVESFADAVDYFADIVGNNFPAGKNELISFSFLIFALYINDYASNTF
jgi:hypothetical protein